ncbi:toxin VasX [Pseudomonas weihenstephanensis]|uniref:Toxin VasX N-terminal region domain-containing protein n=1 Tax=Pseudomonas weihenstephanensis TaxID=1608994 RepID=A0ABS1ZJE0_9PSED|nr:toxin VasX [Pseudomonas weihenstephanensis]MBM1196103.1 hypothetical protein [Pseudomonas weihenstephanensis]
MSARRPNPNHIDLSRSDAKTALGVCPLRKPRVQLLPLRYGRVERLDPASALTMPYRLVSRPLGIRQLRDGWLYVIDNTSGYLHEYRVLEGQVTQIMWQGSEASQDQRDGVFAQHALLFERSTTLHMAYSELQWTAHKCSRMIDSRNERDHFMQHVDLSTAHCATGGQHLLTEAQAQQWLAEVAEQPGTDVTVEGQDPQESEDYAWEDQPHFQKRHIGAVKGQMLAAYEHDHLYLLFNDTLGVMRDLAQEQDLVVSWIDTWVAKERQELKYLVGSYIETLMVLSDGNAVSTGVDKRLFEKTSPAQREAIYAYLNARNTYRGLSPEKATYPGHGLDAQTRGVRQSLNDKKQAMHDALGEALHDELQDDIETLQDHSDATLQGRGLGARGIHDLVRHREMTAYLEAERVHIKRWTARLDRITEDRTQLLIRGDLHRSLWYFDPKVDEQLHAALVAEHNCVRDLCRTDESLEAVGEYLHTHPYYILPAFGSRLDWTFLSSKAADLVKWLDQARTAQDSIAQSHVRVQQLNTLMGQHWANTLDLDPQARQSSQLVQAAYAPAAALRLERWLVTLQASVNGPALKAHLDAFDSTTNRAHRLAGLMALQHEGATLRIASAQDVQQFNLRLTNLQVLLKNEDTYKYNRSVANKNSQYRHSTDIQRQTARQQAEHYHRLLLDAREQRVALVKTIQNSLTLTSTQPAGFIGLQLNLNPQQQAYLNEEINRLRSGIKGGYGEGNAGATVFKSGWLPLGLMLWQAYSLGEAWGAWKKKFTAGSLSARDNLILGGAISGAAATGLSVYQNVHVGLVERSFRSVQRTSGGESGMLLAVKIGKLGLILGGFISALALVGVLVVTINNFNKWVGAIRTGNAGEKAGAYLALVGDIGNVAASAASAINVSTELILVVASLDRGGRAVSQAWVLGGSRFFKRSAALTPWGLLFMAAGFWGEAIYNYHSLDSHQRWLTNCYWGVDNKNWDWPAHAQCLAEATLRPVITDLGLTQPLDKLGRFER